MSNPNSFEEVATKWAAQARDAKARQLASIRQMDEIAREKIGPALGNLKTAFEAQGLKVQLEPSAYNPAPRPGTETDFPAAQSGFRLRIDAHDVLIEGQPEAGKFVILFNESGQEVALDSYPREELRFSEVTVESITQLLQEILIRCLAMDEAVASDGIIDLEDILRIEAAKNGAA